MSDERSGQPPVRAKAEPPESFDCIRCGACCFSDEPDYIRVFRVDLERMGPRARALTTEHEGERVMPMRRGCCIALVVDEEPPRFRCSIYEERPDCCRWLQPGSTLCRTARQARRP